MPTFYGQPKMHKPGVPMSCCFLQWLLVVQLNKHIANILKAYVEDGNNNAKNSSTFSNFIRNVPIYEDEKVVSFDVTSVYTNTPIIDTLSIIKNYINNDNQFTRKTAVPIVCIGVSTPPQKHHSPISFQALP